MKQDHTESGATEAMEARKLLFFADFGQQSPPAEGSCTLEVKLSGDWLPLCGPVTQTMSLVDQIEMAGDSTAGMKFRWNVQVSSGTIRTYLHALAQ